MLPISICRIFRLFLLVLLTAAIALSLPACKKFVEVDLPTSEVAEEAVFSSNEAANSAMLGVYVKMNNTPQAMFAGGISVNAAMYADEIINTTTNTSYDPFTKNSLVPTTTVVNTRIWSAAYPLIYQVNSILEGLEKPGTGVSDSARKQLQGEARLVRAIIYFNMVNLFGDVPLVLTTDYRTTATLPRTSTNEVYGQIIQDLLAAATMLPSSLSLNRGRPSKWAAQALLARVYLYRKQYMLAEAAATEVIQSGLFSLVTNLNQVFLLASPEIIWQLLPVGTAEVNSPEGNIYIPASATTRPTFVLTTDLFTAFEAADQRKAAWTKTVTVSGTNYTFPNKYKVRSGTPATEADVILRFSELYLIRAEARAEQDKISGAGGAEEDLNKSRNRAGLTSLSGSSKTQVVDAIRKERRIELFTEWGHRFFDLKRWGQADQILGTSKSPNWTTADQYWPVPQSQLDANPFLTQNPGY